MESPKSSKANKEVARAMTLKSLTARHILTLTVSLLASVIVSTGCAPAAENKAPGASTAETAKTDNAQIAATLNGAPITVDEVDEHLRQKLFEDQFGSAGGGGKLYDARREAINQIVQDRLVSQAASEAGLSEEEWVAQATAAMPGVTDEEVAAFFEENKSRLGPDPDLGQFQDRIRTFLETKRGDSIYDPLNESAEVVVVIKRERVQVAAVGASLGPDNAPVTIVEFSDFQCPYCSRVVPTIKKIAAQYPDQVRIVYRHLPLSFHAQAKLAAQASICADQQDQFWPFHDKLFEKQKEMGRENLMAYATELELDMATFESCLDAPETVALVDADLAAAAEIGATGTPAFYVNGIMLSGAQPFENFEAVINDELGQSGS
ncbi:MAG: thioredoxin domain-containing protein [Myxococcota bacterium]|nr:thioredoxin domain-containing protein [Myxococcota bacterium]